MMQIEQKSNSLFGVAKAGQADFCLSAKTQTVKKKFNPNPWSKLVFPEISVVQNSNCPWKKAENATRRESLPYQTNKD